MNSKRKKESERARKKARARARKRGREREKKCERESKERKDERVCERARERAKKDSDINRSQRKRNPDIRCVCRYRIDAVSPVIVAVKRRTMRNRIGSAVINQSF